MLCCLEKLLVDLCGFSCFFLFSFSCLYVCLFLWRDMGGLLNFLFLFKKQLLDLCGFSCCCFFVYVFKKCMEGYGGAFFYLFIFKEQISIKGCIFCVWLFVSQLGPAVCCLAGKRTTLVQLPTWLSFLFRSCGLWTLSCDFAPHN